VAVWTIDSYRSRDEGRDEDESGDETSSRLDETADPIVD
jgi:hypothetical protein